MTLMIIRNGLLYNAIEYINFILKSQRFFLLQYIDVLVQLSSNQNIPTQHAYIANGTELCFILMVLKSS